MIKGYHRIAWVELKHDACASGSIKQIRGYAINLIAEAAQVAAMCDKYLKK